MMFARAWFGVGIVSIGQVRLIGCLPVSVKKENRTYVLSSADDRDGIRQLTFLSLRIVFLLPVISSNRPWEFLPRK